jgi:putative transposase
MAEQPSRKQYSTDLTDAEWQRIEPHVPVPLAGGRPRLHPIREILNAIFYILRAGCVWRLLPHDLPPCGQKCGPRRVESQSRVPRFWTANR